MRSLNLHVIHVVTHQGPTGTINAKILLMDQYPPIQLARARKVEDFTVVGINAGSYARVTVRNQQNITAQVRELVYARRS